MPCTSRRRPRQPDDGTPSTRAAGPRRESSIVVGHYRFSRPTHSKRDARSRGGLLDSSGPRVAHDASPSRLKPAKVALCAHVHAVCMVRLLSVMVTRRNVIGGGLNAVAVRASPCGPGRCAAVPVGRRRSAPPWEQRGRAPGGTRRAARPAVRVARSATARSRLRTCRLAGHTGIGGRGPG